MDLERKASYSNARKDILILVALTCHEQTNGCALGRPLDLGSRIADSFRLAGAYAGLIFNENFVQAVMGLGELGWEPMKDFE